jgi:hypothetical protein
MSELSGAVAESFGFLQRTCQSSDFMEIKFQTRYSLNLELTFVKDRILLQVLIPDNVFACLAL